MNLSNLHIRNYRGLRDVDIPLSSLVCITGENNGGKSSVLQAISLFLSGSPIRTTDYFDPTRDVSMEITFTALSSADLDLLAPEHRPRIESLIVNSELTLVRQYGTDGKSQLGYRGLVPKDVRFQDAKIAELISGKKGKALSAAVVSVFPELSEKADEITTQTEAKELVAGVARNLPESEKANQFIPLPTGLDKSIVPMLPERIYIPAVKDLADDTKTAETSPFGKILAILMKSIEPLLANEQDLFENLSRKLTRTVQPDGTLRDERLGEIKTIETTIEKYVKESFANVKLELEIPPPELRTVLSTARIIADDGMKGPIELKGDGLRRAIVFSILRTYVEFARVATRIDSQVGGKPERGYLLLFEEPELFLHPDAQRILFDALGEFSRRNHVVVTTHSPLFLGPEATATFVRLSKTIDSSVSKPFTKARHIDLDGIGLRDEFQIICFENNSAAFFAKKIVLVEGDSDYIVFPHIAETLNGNWNCRAHSVAFVRVGGKGSIARYRDFFDRFDVPVFVITDLDCLDEDFDKLAPSDAAKILRNDLLQIADRVTAMAVNGTSLNSEDIKKAQSSLGLRQLWQDVREAKAHYDSKTGTFEKLDASIATFFAWERKRIRRDCIRKAEHAEVKAKKLALIWALRQTGVFVLENGALEDYYPADVVGVDKPSKAQAFRRSLDSREKAIALSPQQTFATSGKAMSEFEFVFSSIFD